MKLTKRILIFSVFILFLLSCKTNKRVDNTLQNTKLNFKSWLKDTLTILKNEKVFNYKREIQISDDSLSMNIVKKYDINILNNKSANSKELVYALDLLRRNNELPKNEFNLKFTVDMYYTEPMIEELKYNFDSEIEQFIVSQNHNIIEYKFLKGNMIERKVIK